MFGGAVRQRALAVLEFNLEFMAAQDFFLFMQHCKLVDTLGQVNNGRVTSSDQTPFRPKVWI